MEKDKKKIYSRIDSQHLQNNTKKIKIICIINAFISIIKQYDTIFT